MTEGMIKNDDWKHIGDDDFDYSGTNETPAEATELYQSTFNTKLVILFQKMHKEVVILFLNQHLISHQVNHLQLIQKLS